MSNIAIILWGVGRSTKVPVKGKEVHARTHVPKMNDVNGEISALCRAILEDSSNERMNEIVGFGREKSGDRKGEGELCFYARFADLDF
jgi:hypothetical protein